MTALQLADLLDLGLTPRAIASLLFLRWRLQTGRLTEGVPSVAFQRPASYDDDPWETARRNVPRMGYRP